MRSTDLDVLTYKFVGSAYRATDTTSDARVSDYYCNSYRRRVIESSDIAFDIHFTVLLGMPAVRTSTGVLRVCGTILLFPFL